MAINDGGSAYPIQDPQAIHAYAIARTPEDGNAEERDLAYTKARSEAIGGMTLRDAFAMAALQGLMGNPGGPVQECSQSGWRFANCDPDDVAREAYSLADAMIRARTLERSDG